MSDVEQLYSQILTLPQEDRVDLALRILDSVPEGTFQPSEALQIIVADRVARFRAGEFGDAISGDEAIARVRQALLKRAAS